MSEKGRMVRQIERTVLVKVIWPLSDQYIFPWIERPISTALVGLMHK